MSINLSPSTDEQNVYIYKMEYYSAKKRNEILVHVTTWMTLQNIIHETKQTQETSIL